MTTAWPTIELAKLAKVLSGFAFDSTRFSKEEGIPLVRIRDVTRGWSDTYFLGDSDPKFIVNDGDLLVGMDGQFNRELWRGGKALLNQRVCRITADGKSLDQRYLYHFLPQALERIEDETPYVTVKHLSTPKVRGIQVPLPPISEQRRIAEVLDQADVLCVKKREAIAKLETLTHAVFLGMFGDPRDNPNAWPMRPFAEVCPTHLGKMLDAKQQTGKYLRPYVRNVNVQWLSLNLADVAEMDFPPDIRSKYRLMDGDLLICEGGDPGRAAIWHGEIAECYFQKAIHRGRPIRGAATPEYLVMLLWFLSKRGVLADHITSATIAHLTGEKLKRMLIPVPPITLQERFSRTFQAIQNESALQRTSSSTLDDLCASLKHRAFRGEL